MTSPNIESEGSQVPPTVFNPTSPNAFSPPDYDTLPKEPPLYADLFSQQEGHSNPAYTPEIDESSPCSSPQCGSTGSASQEVIEGARAAAPCQNEANHVYIVPTIPDDPPPAYETSIPLVDEHNVDHVIPLSSTAMINESPLQTVSAGNATRH